MVINPILQLLIIFLVILLVAGGFSPIQLNILNMILWLGLGGALFTVFFAIALNGAWKDLKYFYVIPLWIPYSLMMDAVNIWAIILELRGAESKWNKFERTGVISNEIVAKYEKQKE
jgi:biofilm PGA synthesis N-glycosyltransferase PgaC